MTDQITLPPGYATIEEAQAEVNALTENIVAQESGMPDGTIATRYCLVPKTTEEIKLIQKNTVQTKCNALALSIALGTNGPGDVATLQALTQYLSTL